MEESANEGRMMCIQCQNEDLSKMMMDGEEGNKSLDPILGAKGRWGCIYHGELTASQMIFVPFASEAARISYFNHEDRVLKKLGMGKYAGRGKTVSSQSEVLLRMKELKLELSKNSDQEVQANTEKSNEINSSSITSDSAPKKWWQLWR